MSNFYTERFNSMVINDHGKKAEGIVRTKILPNMVRYLAVQKKTGVPKEFIALVHYRESDCNFKTYLGNGDPLNRRTVHVPHNRGPFKTWEEGAIDALTLEHLIGQTVWRIEQLGYFWEDYNGWGYRDYHGMNIENPNCDNLSPYLWGGSNWYKKGKYVRDGKFDPNMVDPQIGCMVLLHYLLILEQPEHKSWIINLITWMKKYV